MQPSSAWIRSIFAPTRILNRRKLQLEVLEPRDTPTFTSIGVAFGQLTFEGDNLSDNLLVTLGAEGSLRHNLVQPDLASDADFDTLLAGEQRLTLVDIGLIVVAGRGGSDHVQIDVPVPSLLFGDEGDDSLIGGPADDLLVTGTGIDTFDGRGGNDSAQFYSFSAVASAVISNSGATISGIGLLGDFFTASGQNVEFYDMLGTDGDDTLDASTFSGRVTFNALRGNNVLVGGSGNDVLMCESGHDLIHGNGGDDIIEVGEGINVFSGGPGADSLRVPFVLSALITNTQLTLDKQSHSDHGFEHIDLQGTDAAAAVYAAGFANGSIDVTLGSGNDVVIGTPNADAIRVGEGNNLVYALAGDDFVYAGFGTNYLLGGAGSDSLDVGVMRNATLTNSRLTIGGLSINNHGFEAVNVYGSEVRNVINAAQFTGPTYIDGAGGNDALTTGSGADFVFGGDGDDAINTGSGDDVTGGGPGKDWIRTGAGDDYIDFDGADRVDGGTGTDGFNYYAAGSLVELTDDALTANGVAIAPNHHLEFGAIFAGPIASTLDASRFSRGPISLYAGPGDDVLILGRFGGTMVGDPSSTDTARIVGTNGNDAFVFDGFNVSVNGGTPVTLASLFYYVELDGQGETDSFTGNPGIITGLRLINIESHLNAGDDQTLPSGSLSRTGTYADNGSGGPWTATVDFGDGEGQQPLALSSDGTFTLSHTYTQLGEFTVRVKLANDDGTEYLATFVLRVVQL